MPISSFPLPSEEEPLDSSSQVAWLRSLGDREALFQIMDSDRRSAQGLEAAEALAQLGDVRGLDHLIATLNNPGSGLRMEAAEILQDLNHPRGMRALREGGTETQSSTRAAQREEVYEELNASSTDELVAIWHQNDRAARADVEFEVIEAILTERLGKLPRRAAGSPEDREIDAEVDPRIQQLWKQGDADGLRRIMARDPESQMRLEAAEALADLGDEDGLDFLIGALDEEEEEYSEIAAEMLDWLDLPDGNEALRARGYALETDGASLIERQPARPLQKASPESGHTRQTTVPAPNQSSAERSWASRIPRMPGEFSAPDRQGDGASPSASPAVIVTGAAGGLLGFITVCIGLDLLGLKPLPEGLQGWLEPSMVYWLFESLVVGAVTGSLGSRAVRAMATRGGDDLDEQDARLALGALMSGAAVAAAVGVVRFVFGG